MHPGLKPRVIEIRPKVFYGGGLFPLDVECPQFVVPCIFSPTKWVRRKLSGAEVCKAKDLTEGKINGLSS